MSEQVPASEPSTGSAAAPAQSAQNAALPASQVEAPAFPTFGSSRGSGLARGKRTGGSTAAKAAPAANYQPSAIQMVTPVREYVNPFGGETSVPSPEAPEAPAPAPVVESTPAPVAAAPEVASQVQPAAPAPVEPEAKAELNILPPEPIKHPAQSWDNTGATPAAAEEPRSFERRPRREDRRGERRDDRRGDRRDDRREERREERPSDGQPAAERPIFRPERRDREAQAPRPEQGARREDRRPAPAVAAETPAPEAPKKSTGLLGWLKGLFSSEPAPAEKPAQEKRDERPRDGQGRHGGRRHGRHGGHGGRDRQFRHPNPNAQASNESSSEGVEGRNEGGFRRRRRGGRGRGFRPEGRGDGNSGS